MTSHSQQDSECEEVISISANLFSKFMLFLLCSYYYIFL